MCGGQQSGSKWLLLSKILAKRDAQGLNKLFWFQEVFPLTHTFIFQFLRVIGSKHKSICNTPHFELPPFELHPIRQSIVLPLPVVHSRFLQLVASPDWSWSGKASDCSVLRNSQSQHISSCVLCPYLYQTTPQLLKSSLLPLIPNLTNINRYNNIY